MCGSHVNAAVETIQVLEHFLPVKASRAACRFFQNLLVLVVPGLDSLFQGMETLLEHATIVPFAPSVGLLRRHCLSSLRVFHQLPIVWVLSPQTEFVFLSHFYFFSWQLFVYHLIHYHCNSVPFAAWTAALLVLRQDQIVSNVDVVQGW
jgi:hypothetical protein